MQTCQLGTVVPALAVRHGPLWASEAPGPNSLRPEQLDVYRGILSDPEVRAPSSVKSLFFRVSLNDIQAAVEATDQVLRQISRELGQEP